MVALLPNGFRKLLLLIMSCSARFLKLSTYLEVFLEIPMH